MKLPSRGEASGPGSVATELELERERWCVMWIGNEGGGGQKYVKRGVDANLNLHASWKCYC